ncbi:hypothetical protein IDZ49_11930 [Francisella tularensis]|nr:hypothetical protein [Francisella tularensis]
MAESSASLQKLADANLPYLLVLTGPTSFGVSASLAILGDILIEDPKAVIGFSGPILIALILR